MTAAAELSDEAGFGSPPDTRFVDAAGIRWHVRSVGSGPSLLLIHGAGSSIHTWDGVADRLRSDFAMTIVDLPGHGLTQAIPAQAMTLDNIALRLGALLGSLGVVPEFVAGHSAGAAIAIRMVLDGRISPPQQIVAVNGALMQWQNIARWLFPQLARVLAGGGIFARILAARAAQPGAVERMLAGTGRAPPAASVAKYEALLRDPRRVQATLDMMARWDLGTLEQDMPRLAVPLELIACSDDLAVSPDVAFRIKERLQLAHVTYLRNLGHLAQEEDPVQVAACLRAIWSKRRSQAAGGAGQMP